VPRRVEFKSQRDFTAGLHLDRDPFVIPKEGTPDCLNVDLDGRGGFYLRRGVDTFRDEELPAAAHSLLPFTTTAGTSEVVVGAGTSLYRWNGSTWASIFSGRTGPYRSIVFKDRMYVVFGDDTTYRWNGSTATTLSDPAPSNFNDDLTSPTVPPANGRFPKAYCVATYQNSVMVGNVVEGSTQFPCRVRWSHPGFPEDWVSFAYADIEPEDGDEITALVPMQDRLIVFKHNSIHAVYGTPSQDGTAIGDFQITPIARDVGAVSQEAVVTTDVGIFFWHESTGLHHLTSDPTKGTTTTWVWEPLWPAIEDGRINDLDDVMVGWINRRAWVSVKWEGSSTRNRTFVFDPFVGKKGGWTAYDLALGPYLAFTPPQDEAIYLATHTRSHFLLELDQYQQYFDKTGEWVEDVVTELLTEDGDELLLEDGGILGATEGSDEVPIDCYFLTVWQDAGEPIIKKRWKRPEVVLLSGQDSTVTVSAYRDYDSTHAFKTFHLTTDADDGAAQWDEAEWDEAIWERETGDLLAIKRGSPLGNANAVALKFTGPQNKKPFRIDALTMKYVPRRVRN
jgi:hypothetical protein